MLKFTFFLLIICIHGIITAQKTDKFRVVILTDMTHDDGNSLIRYLYYAHQFETEAIIITPQLPDYNFNDKGPWEKGQSILIAYKQEYSQLSKHHIDYPTPEQLQSVTKKGHGALPIIWLTNTKKFKGQIASRYVESEWGDIRFEDWIGEGNNPNGEPKDSEGSEFLQQVFAKDDDRPIFVEAWGGPVTFVQALYRYKQRNSTEKLKKLLDKLHVFGILLQDISFDYLINLDDVQAQKCANMGDVKSTYQGERVHPKWLLHDAGHFWHYVFSRDSGYVKPMTANEVNGHGPMSEIYDDGGEGDTPSFLYLLSANLGLNDPLNPSHGSWGSMFQPMEKTFPEGYYHTCNVDVIELKRWVNDAKSSFENRLNYSLKNPDEVNHEPVSVVNGKKGIEVVTIKVKPGKTIKLDASKSFDPDGDNLNFNWFVYREAGNFTGDFNISNPISAKQNLVVPDDIKGKEIHIILEVKDNGKPGLVSYRRFILKG
jgi:hypothetical protein